MTNFAEPESSISRSDRHSQAKAQRKLRKKRIWWKVPRPTGTRDESKEEMRR